MFSLEGPYENTNATSRRTSKNKRFNEQINRSARPLRKLYSSLTSSANRDVKWPYSKKNMGTKQWFLLSFLDLTWLLLITFQDNSLSLCKLNGLEYWIFLSKWRFRWRCCGDFLRSPMITRATVWVERGTPDMELASISVVLNNQTDSWLTFNHNLLAKTRKELLFYFLN